MKNRFKLFAILFLASVGLLGCEENFNPEDEVQREVTTTINVNAFPLVQQQKDFQEEYQLFNEGIIPDDDVKLRVRAYFYKDAKLESMSSTLVDNVAKPVALSKSDLSSGVRYDVVIVADFVMMSGNSIDLEFWSVKNEREYNSIKVVDQGYVGLQYRSIGATNVPIYGGDKISVDIEGLGMLAYVYFSDIDASKTSKVKYTWTGVKEFMLRERRALTTNTLYDTYDTSPSYSGFFDMMYILPNENGACEFGWEFYGTNDKVYMDGGELIQVHPSDNRIWYVNCETNSFYNEYFNY